MSKYYLYVSMPSSKFNTVVEAYGFTINANTILFVDKKELLVAAYPTQYTIIEKIERNESKNSKA